MLIEQNSDRGSIAILAVLVDLVPAAAISENLGEIQVADVAIPKHDHLVCRAGSVLYRKDTRYSVRQRPPRWCSPDTAISCHNH